MSKHQRSTARPGCTLSRRRFIAAASAGALGTLASTSLFQACGGAGKTRVRVIYALHAVVQPGPDWPNVGFDFQPVMDRTTGTLARAFPKWELATSMAKGPDEAQKILEADAAAPMGYLNPRTREGLAPIAQEDDSCALHKRFEPSARGAGPAPGDPPENARSPGVRVARAPLKTGARPA